MKSENGLSRDGGWLGLQDDEFDIQLDDDSPAAGASEAPPAAPPAESKPPPQQPQPQAPQQAQQPLVSGPHRYVRSGLEQPGPGQPRPAHALLEADEPSLIPGVAAPSAAQQLARPAGPPKRWPHTLNYNVPPQGTDLARHTMGLASWLQLPPPSKRRIEHTGIENRSEKTGICQDQLSGSGLKGLLKPSHPEYGAQSWQFLPGCICMPAAGISRLGAA